jgi:mannan endo-1,4-beta-mannosidase
MFNSWLTRLAGFFYTLKDKDGNLIPFIFRPYHEHSGTFFWWGRERCSDEEYAALWRYTVDFLRKAGLHNILYAYNTDKVYSEEEYLRGYPGDDYIDMLSIDWYGKGEEFNKHVDKALGFTTALAREKGKLHALSECGPLSTDLQNILAKYESSYVLTWRHVPPKGNRPQRQSDHDDQLRQMKASGNYLFFEDIQ